MLRFLKQVQTALLRTLDHDQFAVAKAAAYSSILTLFPAVLLISVSSSLSLTLHIAMIPIIVSLCLHH